MRFQPDIASQLLQPLCRRTFAKTVARHDGDAYVKELDSWTHLVALVTAQISGAQSLRALQTVWNANAQAHAHLGVGDLARSTLSDANKRRPVAIFSETFTRLAAGADRVLRREGETLVRIIDSSPIPLSTAVAGRTSNGRIRGMKLHVVYDSGSDLPRVVDITEANVNDVDIGRMIELEPGARYVFDKGYCDYAWFTRIHDIGATFVTRKKENVTYAVERQRVVADVCGEGFAIEDDADVVHTTKSCSRSQLTIPMRRIRVRRDDGGGTLTLITNDRVRTAVEIAMLYKTRWQIELLFRWIKQNLKIKRFLGRSKTAIQLQIIAAMIAYVLLRIAAKRHAPKLSALRFAECVGERWFMRTPLDRVDKPPLTLARLARAAHPDQLHLQWQ